MSSDRDAFNMAEASTELVAALMLAHVPDCNDADAAVPTPGDATAADGDLTLGGLIDALRSMVTNTNPDGSAGVDPALVAQCLGLITQSEMQSGVAGRDGCVNPAIVAIVRRRMRAAIGAGLAEELYALHEQCRAFFAGRETDLSQEQKAARALNNAVLSLLIAPFTAEGTEEQRAVVVAAGFSGIPAVEEHLAQATTMTDEMAALSFLAGLPHDFAERTDALAAFYEKYKDHDLVVDKWLNMHAFYSPAQTVWDMRANTEFFHYSVPNKVYSLVYAFSVNPTEFHTELGYHVLADTVAVVDQMNPQVAARVAGAFSIARILTPELKALARTEIEYIQGHHEVSTELSEVLSRILSSM
jgi:aminopeptidase N